jgi:hypothetical protein
MTERAEFSTLTRMKALLKYTTCPGLVEIKMTCGRPLGEGVEFDHIKRCEITPDNSVENCRPLCPVCHRIKTTLDAKAAAKGRRIRGENKPKRSRPIPGSKSSSLKKKMDGTVVYREGR